MNKISRQLIKIAISIEKQQKLYNMILNNSELKQTKELTLGQFCKILNISKNYYHENSQYIKPLLQKIQIKIVDGRKTQIDKLSDAILKDKILTNNSIVKVQELLKAINISYQTYKKHEEEIKKILNIRNIQIYEKLKKTKKYLQELIQNNIQGGTLLYADELQKKLNISYSFYRKYKNQIKSLLQSKNIILCQKKQDEIRFLINQIPNNYNFTSITQLCQRINLNPYNFSRYKKIIFELLKNKNINVKKHHKLNLEKLILQNQQLNKYKTIGIKSLSNILNISESTIRNNIDEIVRFLNIRKIYFLQENRSDFNKKIIQNDNLQPNTTITIKQLCQLCNISQNAFYNNYQEILNLLKLKQIKLKQKINYSTIVEECNQLNNGDQITITDLCKLLKINKQTYYLYKNQITEGLKKKNITIIKTKSMLQKDFEEKIQELTNIKTIKKEVIIDCTKQLNECFEKCIKKSIDILNKHNNIKLSSTNFTNDQTRLKNLLNILNRYITNLNKAPFDFYVETDSGNKYLIENQGEQHYIAVHNRGNIATRIIIDASKMLVACKYNCNFIATYDVKAKKRIKESLDVFNDFYMTTEEAIQLIKNDGTVDKHKIKRCAITMLNKIRNKFEQKLDQLLQKINGQQKTNKEILQQIRKY